MSIIVHCAGDDGSVLQAFRQRLPGRTVIPWEPDWMRKPGSVASTEVTAAITWMPPPDFFDGLPHLTHVYAFAAGVDQLLNHPGLPPQVTVIRLRDAGMARQMAEYVLYGVLHAQRHMGQLRQAQVSRHWAHDISVRDFRQMRVGILGAGALGQQVASHLSANGYPVSCWSRTERTSADAIRQVYGRAALPELLCNSDVLVCLLPLTAATENILNAELFAHLPHGAFLINPGRGNHLVEADLLEALNCGQLSGAMLDVFREEPLPRDHPFWSHPAVLITPHVAAKSLERESVDQIVENIQRIERGELPIGIVDRQRGY